VKLETRNDQVGMTAGGVGGVVRGGVVRVGLQRGQSPGASIMIRWFIPLRGRAEMSGNGLSAVSSSKGALHLADTATGIVVGAGVMARPVTIRSHAVVHVCLV